MLMSGLQELKIRLRPGKFYRRNNLAKWSKSLDRHVNLLLSESLLQKVSRGLYYCPKNSAFGAVPPEEKALIREFLQDDRFLITSPNVYNGLGIGTTQLYNKKIVYNCKRQGALKLCNRTFEFQKRPFPKTITSEFLILDLLNNLDFLEEDHDEVLKNVSKKLPSMSLHKVKFNANKYGNVRTKKLFSQVLEC
jgi:hypothetical protein